MATTRDQYARDAGVKLTITATETVIKVGAPTREGSVGRWAYEVTCANWASNSLTFQAKIRGRDTAGYSAGGPERRTLAGTDVAGGTAITADSAGVVFCDQFDLFIDATIGGAGPITVYLRPMEG